jgi:hypothetical protein
VRIIVNRGRSIMIAVKPGVVVNDESTTPPVRRVYGPTCLLEVPDEEAQYLIDRGFARKYEARAPLVAD